MQRTPADASRDWRRRKREQADVEKQRHDEVSAKLRALLREHPELIPSTARRPGRAVKGPVYNVREWNFWPAPPFKFMRRGPALSRLVGHSSRPSADLAATVLADFLWRKDSAGHPILFPWIPGSGTAEYELTRLWLTKVLDSGLQDNRGDECFGLPDVFETLAGWAFCVLASHAVAYFSTMLCLLGDDDAAMDSFGSFELIYKQPGEWRRLHGPQFSDLLTDLRDGTIRSFTLADGRALQSWIALEKRRTELPSLALVQQSAIASLLQDLRESGSPESAKQADRARRNRAGRRGHPIGDDAKLAEFIFAVCRSKFPDDLAFAEWFYAWAGIPRSRDQRADKDYPVVRKRNRARSRDLRRAMDALRAWPFFSPLVAQSPLERRPV